MTKSATNTVSIQGQAGIRATLRDGAIHAYVLNDTKATKVMIKNARLPPISAPEVTHQTSQLQLSTGSFSQVIQALFNHWNTFDLIQGQELVEGETKVKLLEVRIDTEITNKRVDALAKFCFQESNISFFAYYTNQSIMVQGKTHKEFLDTFLAPLLKRMIADKMTQIVNFNNMVISELDGKPKTVDQDDSIWSCATPNRDTLNVKLRRNTKCDICGKDCSGISQLKIHITNAHANSTRAKPRAVTRSRQILTKVSRVATTVDAINQDTLDILDSSESEADEEEESLGKNPPQPKPTVSRVASTADAINQDILDILDSSELEADEEEVSLEENPPQPKLNVKPTVPKLAEEPPSPRSKEQYPSVVQTPPDTSISLPTDPGAGISLLTLSSTSPSVDPGAGAPSPPFPTQPRPQPFDSTKENEVSESDRVVPVEVEVIILSKSQVIPETAWAAALNKSIEDTGAKIVDVQNEYDEIEEVEPEQAFQCAVCDQVFMDQESVSSHFESHGNAESVISLMKTIHNLESTWNRKFVDQARQILNLQHQVHSLQTKQSKKASIQPPPVPAFPSFSPGASTPLSTPTQEAQTYAKTPSSNTYAQTVKGPSASEPTFNCTDCRYKCFTLSKLDRHIASKHERPNLEAAYTLFVGDSRVKSLKPRIVEKALGGGLLSVPGSLKVPELPQGRSKGHPGRGYCSSRDWPHSKFPEASLEDRVPELLAARTFTNLVIQAPCNDISNIIKVQDRSKHQNLAALSAHNTLAVVERALRVTPSLKKVVILEQIPRADSDYLTGLAEHSNEVFRELVASSNHRNNITIASSQSLQCHTEQKILDLFGARDDARSDGIHLAGSHGRQLYTDFVLSSLKSAKLATPPRWSGARPAPRREGGQEEQGNWSTGNRFGPLSN